MEEEFQAAVYGGSWWLSPRTACNYSPCSSDIIADMENNMGPFWPQDLMDMKSKSSDESSDGSMVVFQDIQKRSGRTTTMPPDSTFQMITTAFSDLAESGTMDWNQNLLPRVQEGMNTGGDDGLKAEIEADDHQVFTLDQQQYSLNFPTTFPISSTSYGYTSSLVQSLLSSNSPPPSPPRPPQLPPQQPPYDFQSNSNNLSFVHSFPKRQVPGNFDHPSTNNTPFLSASLAYKEHNHQEIQDLGSFKRPRLETPSPLPIFKVRKEKLGDRITALQQLVSPFGKTDTASVLHEAIEYIKLLHDQVNILSAPYKKGATKQLDQPIHGHDKVKDKGHKQDLRSLGLCLVPVSSTFPVATGFWTPSYEGSFK